MRGLILAIALTMVVALYATAVAAPAGSGDMQTPFATTAVNTCNGDDVVITGVLHTTETVADNHQYVHTNWQDVRGVTLLGRLYQANDTTHLVARETPAGSTSYFQDEFELISLGPAPNLIVRMKVGVSIDRNGNPTPIMEARADCTG